MELSQEQLTQLREEGWIFMPDYFSAEEVAILKTESRKVFDLERDEIYLEKDGTPRSAFAVHRLNERRFLTRERDALDRRSEHLELTAKGRAAYEDLHEVARAYDAELLAAFSPEEARSLRNMLSAIARGEGGSAR